MREMGLVHIYMGEGKGKTTAAVGLASRVSGRGGSAVFAQFLKGADSGERKSLALLPGVTLMPVPEIVKFTFQMTDDEKRQCAEYTARQFAAACVRAADKDILILDEVLGAIQARMLPQSAVVNFLRCKPAALEVVLTGREADAELLAMADYVSRVDCVKHPYQRGVPARRGIEY